MTQSEVLGKAINLERKEIQEITDVDARCKRSVEFIRQLDSYLKDGDVNKNPDAMEIVLLLHKHNLHNELMAAK